MTNELENELRAQFLLRQPYVIPTLRLFIRPIIAARAPSGAIVRVGRKGQADLYGYYRGGRGIEIELKSVDAVTTEKQLEWEAFCLGWGVLYRRYRALRGETAEQSVERWLVDLVTIST